MHKKIKENLLRAYSEMVPKDFFDRIEQNIVPQERTVQMKKRLNLKSLQRSIIGMAAALILVVSGIFGGIYYSNHWSVDSLVDIDVNPGIELSLNKKERVLKAKAINDEAQEILQGMDLKNTDLNVAVNAIIGSMVQKGYLDQEIGGSILISVQNENAAKADQLRKQINDQVHSYLTLHETEASVFNQTIEQNRSDAEEFAATHKISLGKAVFILNLAQKDPALKAEALAQLSLREIAEEIKKNKVDISDIVDYDADDSLQENIADEIEDTNEDLQEEPQQTPAPQTPAETKPTYIGIEKAKSIALKHAGLSASEVRFEKAETERDDGIVKYEIEFSKGTAEYDYEIHAETGKILVSEKDIDEKPSNASTSNPSETKPTYIGIEKAKSIALKHAGLSASEVRFEKAETDRDDGIVKYEIEFSKGSFEYSCEIRATDGKILDFEKEIDD